MKLFSTIIAVLALTCTTTALALPEIVRNQTKLQSHEDQKSTQVVELLRNLAANYGVSPKDDQFDFYFIFADGYLLFTEGYLYGFRRISNLLSVEEFDPTALSQIDELALTADFEIASHMVEALSVITPELPMEELAVVVKTALETVINNIFHSYEAEMEVLVERNDPTGRLLPLVQLITVDTLYDMDLALQPTMEFLEKFLPRHH